MSRVGRQPIAIPSKVEVKFEKGTVRVKGPLGELTFALPHGVEAKTVDGKVLVENKSPDRHARASWGTARARIANLIEGVEKGFSKSLLIQGLGFRAAVQGAKITFNLGFSHPIDFPLPKGVKAELDAKTNVLTVSGADRELVGAIAANIRLLRKPEPYKGKGIRYVNEHIVRKAGKSAAGGSGSTGGGAKK